MTLQQQRERDALARAIEALANALASKKLAAYLRLAWPILNPGVPLVWNWHLDAKCDHLEAVTAGHIKYLGIAEPPSHSKTTVVCHAWPTWEWQLHPHYRWGFAAYGSALTNRDNIKRRTVIESEWYQQAFRPSWRLKEGRKGVTSFANTVEGEMVATSVGGAGLGFHFDRLVGDDLLKASDVYGAGLKKAIDWYCDTWERRGRDGAAIVNVMQRLHKRDPIGFLQERDGDLWTWLVLPEKFEKRRRYFTSIGWTDPRTEDGELLNPVRFPAEEVERIWSDPNEGGRRRVAAQRQQDPVSSEGSMFPASKWRYYKPGELPEFDEFDALCFSWDTKKQKGESRSAVVGWAIGRKGPKFYILDEIRLLNAGFVDTRRAMLSSAELWPEVSSIYVELAASGSDLAEVLEDEIPGIIGVYPKESKEQRAEYISPLHDAGNILLPSPEWARPEYSSERVHRLAKVVHEIVTEFEEFPHGDFNDRVDAASQGIRQLHQRSKAWDMPSVDQRRQKPVSPLADPLVEAQRAHRDAALAVRRGKPPKPGEKFTSRWRPT